MGTSRKIPREARPARRTLRRGGTAEGYLLHGTFHPFDTTLNRDDFAGSAVPDSSISYSVEPGVGSYDSGGSASYDSGGSSSCDTASY